MRIELSGTCLSAESIPEADMVMGFQNYGNLPNSLKGLLGVENGVQENARVQVRVLL